MLQSGFFLSRQNTDQDSGFSSKIGRIPTRSEWLDSLGFGTKIMDKSLGTLLHFWGVFQFTQLPNPPLNPQTKLDTYIQNFFQVSTLNRVGRENCKTISKRMHSLWTGLRSRVELGRMKVIFFHPFPKPRDCSQAKDALFHEETQKWQKNMNTALLSQGRLSMIVATLLNAQKNQRFSCEIPKW